MPQDIVIPSASLRPDRIIKQKTKSWKGNHPSIYLLSIKLPESSRIWESAPLPFHLSTLSRIHMTITQSPQAAASLSLTPLFLPPLWSHLFLVQIRQATSILTWVKARFKQSLPSLDPSWEFQCKSIWDRLSCHIWLTSMWHIWLTSMWHRFFLRREWGKLGGSRRLLSSTVSRRSWFTTSGKLSASLRNSHTAVILTRTSKVNEMYTHDILKGNASYLKLNKVSHDALKRHVIQPGMCHVDDVDMWTVWRGGLSKYGTSSKLRCNEIGLAK